MFRPRSLVVALVLIASSLALCAGDLRIPLPKKSKYTPVQALNRDGVKAVEKHEYAHAKKLFYKAYLIDPNDPFTLNNLGYMAELDGDADRARRFYALSAEMGSDAIIDKSSDELVKGKPVSLVAGHAEDKGIGVNKLNNQAIALLAKDRAPESDLILQKALTIDPQNPFTLNNLGYTKEKEGELQAAYQFYTASANRDSKQTVEVAIDKEWRGRAISDVAHDNAKALYKRLRNDDNKESQVALLNLRGVSALNRNDRQQGREFIQKAFKLNPNDAFTLNNMGYLAEIDGDRETAEFYYERAREANQKNARIALATRRDVQGKKIGDVADSTDQLVQTRIEEARLERERLGGPVVLMSRDKQTVVEPAQAAYNPPKQLVSNANGDLVLPPLKRSSNVVMPTSTANNNTGVVTPLPDNEQPKTIKEGDNNGGLIMPLPDNSQPAATPQPQTQQPAVAAQPSTNQGQSNGGLLMPLPDKQGGSSQAQSAPNQQQPDTLLPPPDDQQPNQPR
jgi:Flp pilus assembly protein TadD